MPCSGSSLLRGSVDDHLVSMHRLDGDQEVFTIWQLTVAYLTGSFKAVLRTGISRQLIRFPSAAFIYKMEDALFARDQEFSVGVWCPLNQVQVMSHVKRI